MMLNCQLIQLPRPKAKPNYTQFQITSTKSGQYYLLFYINECVPRRSEADYLRRGQFTHNINATPLALPYVKLFALQINQNTFNRILDKHAVVGPSRRLGAGFEPLKQLSVTVTIMFKFAGPVPPGSSDLLSMRQTRGLSTQIGCQGECAASHGRLLVQQPSQSNEIKLVSLSEHLDFMNDITYTIKIKRVLSRTNLIHCERYQAQTFQRKLFLSWTLFYEWQLEYYINQSTT